MKGGLKNGSSFFFENVKFILEYGPGTGVFTEELIKRKREDTVLLVIELNEILKNTVKILKKEGKFITFQYTLLKRNLMKQYFQDINITYEFRNIPPAFIFNCGIQ